MPDSKTLFADAQRYIPGGVNSPVRAFGSVGGDPVFISRASGPFIYDTQGRRYIDYVGSWGPMVCGHAHPAVIEAVQRTTASGLSFGAPCVAETELARRICEAVPSIELVRMVNSGTEATMSAIRLARAYTGREAVVKFEGCYHGHSDALLVKAGSGALTHGVPTSPGIPADTTKHTVTLRFNDIEAVEACFERMGDDIACVIVEPVAGNMNCVPPVPGFLEALRAACDASGALLLFDEVMTGFRVGHGGAQARYGVTPDLTTLGKVIGGGMPVGAFGGKRDIMERVSPLGPVYQAGTLSGNPVAMAAGIATLDLVSQPGFYEALEDATARLCDGLVETAREARVPLTVNRVGGMFGYFFTDEPEVRYHEQVTACDGERFKRFFHAMLSRGIYLAPSAFEAGFVSSAHTADEIDATIAAAGEALRA